MASPATTERGRGYRNPEGERGVGEEEEKQEKRTIAAESIQIQSWESSSAPAHSLWRTRNVAPTPLQLCTVVPLDSGRRWVPGGVLNPEKKRKGGRVRKGRMDRESGREGRREGEKAAGQWLLLPAQCAKVGIVAWVRVRSRRSRRNPHWSTLAHPLKPHSTSAKMHSTAPGNPATSIPELICWSPQIGDKGQGVAIGRPPEADNSDNGNGLNLPLLVVGLRGMCNTMYHRKRNRGSY
ncbi:hypothetical protein VTG60DRAFT_738 [Thermothelomyces hinnuleus]